MKRPAASERVSQASDINVASNSPVVAVLVRSYENFSAGPRVSLLCLGAGNVLGRSLRLTLAAFYPSDTVVVVGGIVYMIELRVSRIIKLRKFVRF